MFNSDVKIYIKKHNRFVYSDGFMVCGNMKTAQEDHNAIINPMLIIEVLSQSTGNYDRGQKFHKYCTLPSFCEYLLISQHQPIVDSLYRMDKSFWKMVTIIGLDKSVYINSLDCMLPMKEIYHMVQQLLPPQSALNFDVWMY